MITNMPVLGNEPGLPTMSLWKFCALDSNSGRLRQIEYFASAPLELDISILHKAVLVKIPFGEPTSVVLNGTNILQPIVLKY
jgi:hypothetical protein